MTNEKALDLVNAMIEHGSMSIDDKSDSIHSYGFWFAVRDALEKTIPLEPHINQYTGTECYCRACGEYVGWIDALAGDLKKYCPECGQKIDQEGTK